jgi:uncharacterized protein
LQLVILCMLRPSGFKIRYTLRQTSQESEYPLAQSVYSYLSPKVEARTSPGRGTGVFAREPVAAGELLAMWGGRVVSGAALMQLPPVIRSLSLQIDADLYMAPIEPEDADRVNHSCNPNAGIRGQVGLVAMRAILPDEEICFDYAMSEANDFDDFDCQCGAPDCRGRVSATDWQRSDLQARYRGYFSTYIQSLIDGQ